MHIYPRDKSPSNTFCFIIRSTPYFILFLCFNDTQQNSLAVTGKHNVSGLSFPKKLLKPKRTFAPDATIAHLRNMGDDSSLMSQLVSTG